MGLILDTSILISAERKLFDLEAFLDSEAPGVPLFISAITASELLHGVHRADKQQRRKRKSFVEGILAALPALPFDLSAAQAHAKLWADLEASGERIGPHDLIIAATCLTLDHSVATLNERELERVPGLTLANAVPYRINR